MSENNYFYIWDCKISKTIGNSLIQRISDTILNNRKLLITYTATHTLNLLYENKELRNLFSEFDIVHPDGMGIYLASKFIYGNDGLKSRFTGSDFYLFLINRMVENKWRIFFFGDSWEALNKISEVNAGLNVVGTESGYDYNDEVLINKINNLKLQILFVGLGCPKQETWIINNKDKIEANVIMAVGDGIKVFAGTKIRGPIIFRKIGLEWLVRLISNPKMYGKRYLLGIPLFIVRIIKYKLRLLFKLAEN